MIEPSFVEEMDSDSFFDHIDDLLHFPADDLDVRFAPGVNSNNTFPTIWPVQSDPFPSSDSLFSGNTNSDLSAVPYADMVQLDWLSNFVEDSFSNGDLSMNKQDSVSNNTKTNDFTYYHFPSSSPASVLESSSSSCGEKGAVSGCYEIITPACRGARSKRRRPPTFNPRPAIQTSVESPLLVEMRDTEEEEEEEKKKKKKKKMKQRYSCGGVRKCLHCEITKTPQWRAGPMGPKTLCNACGVRHKSGRLFPEYRPAGSPTFVAHLHSNSHKKVSEMRSRAQDDRAAIEGSPQLLQ